MNHLPAYAELHCLTNFTLLRGASHPVELVKRAKAMGYSALAITDECSFAGIVRAHEAAREHGVKLIIGTEVQIENGPKLVLLATDRESYGHISMLVTRGRMRAGIKKQPPWPVMAVSGASPSRCCATSSISDALRDQRRSFNMGYGDAYVF